MSELNKIPVELSEYHLQLLWLCDRIAKASGDALREMVPHDKQRGAELLLDASQRFYRAVRDGAAIKAYLDANETNGGGGSCAN